MEGGRNGDGNLLRLEAQATVALQGRCSSRIFSVILVALKVGWIIITTAQNLSFKASGMQHTIYDIVFFLPRE